MNPFTTDHPLASKSSWFDTPKHPTLSFVCSTFVLGLIFTPFVLQRLYDYAISDIGAEANLFPQPLVGFILGVVIAFVLSVVGALPVVLVYRVFALRWRRR
jgi:hypothetical protein